MRELPILVTVPSGGISVPGDILERTVLSREDLFEIADPYIRQVFNVSDYVVDWKSSQISPAFINCDLPRSPTEGMGGEEACVVLWDAGQPIYHHGTEPDEWMKEDLLKRYYDPFHKGVARASLQRNVLIGLSCRVMPKDEWLEPDVLIRLSDGDGKTCARPVTMRLRESLCRAFGFSAEEIVISNLGPLGHTVRTYGQNPIPWIQIELNRATYLKKPWFDRRIFSVTEERIQELRGQFLEALSSWTEELACDQNLERGHFGNESFPTGKLGTEF